MTIGHVAAHLTFGGSITAMVSGLVALATEQSPSAGAQIVGMAGLVTALGGLVTALGNQVITVLKIFVEERRQDREAKLARHDLNNRLNAANLEIQNLSEVIEENRRRIEDQHQLIMSLARGHGVNRGRIEDQQLSIANLSEVVDEIKTTCREEPPRTPSPAADPQPAGPT
ncbi:MAG: hypothetical protein ACM35G_00905 [Planctomycetaceae bacterium]